MIYIVDIDGTICNHIEDYHDAIPIKDRIEKINKLFEDGHTIIYWTARGMSRGIDYTALTYRQLLDWGCKFSELRMCKPSYDVWIDDKANWIFE
jgi:hypothetical protein